MIEVKVDDAALQKISKEIGDLPHRAPTILKNAVNETGKKAMKRIRKEIDRRYDYDDSKIQLMGRLKRKSASYANPQTVITGKSPMNPIGDFNVKPFQVLYGKSRPNIIRGHVLQSSAMKELRDGNRKAFVVRFRSGHEGVVERNPNKHMLDNPKKEGLRALLSPSVAHMLGKGYEAEEDDIALDLQKNIRKYIDRFMKGR